MWINQSTVEFKQVNLLNANGELDDKQLTITTTDEELLEMYIHMMRARIFDEFALRYQRQGRIGTYASVRGQEAAQVGSSFALGREDWVYPSYREVAVSFVKGMPFTYQLTYLMGKSPGKLAEDLTIFPLQIIIGAQLLHAVGGAWASKYKGENTISVGYMGDGGTSEGDFHEALNLAGVLKLPIIFFIQNNQWAISTPFHKQTASKSIAQKAIAYGIEGIQVDGNDILAVHEVMKLAVEKARANEPILIEAVTYRQGAHTTSDDPTKYRAASETEEWLQLDPIKRFSSYLIGRELWSNEQQLQLVEQLESDITVAFNEAQTTAAPSVQQVIDLVYAKEVVADD